MPLASLAQSDLHRKSIFLRADFNVPLRREHIEDDSRILHALPSLKRILTQTSRLIIASHLGRPTGPDPSLSLAPIANALATHLEKEVILLSQYDTEAPSLFFSRLQAHQIILLENLRFHPEEKSGDSAFCERLTRGIDIYVNEAFAVSHRQDASVIGIPKRLGAQRCYAGLGLESEVQNLSQVLLQPRSPLAIVMGGSKVADKIGALLNLMPKAHSVLIGGAMALPLLKAQGHHIGATNVSAQELKLAQVILANAKQSHVKLHLPQDHIITASLQQHAPHHHHPHPHVPAHHYAVDIGPYTREHFTQTLHRSGTIIWNGPMGIWEWQNLHHGSLAIAQALAESSAYTVVGGGDSLACLNSTPYAHAMDHLCSGGGAMLAYLENGTLPALRLLKKQP